MAHAAQRAQDENVVQDEGENAPQHRIRKPEHIGGEPRRNTDGGVHQGDGDEVARDVSRDLARDVDGLLLVAERRQDLDDPAQEQVAGAEQKKQKERHGGKFRQHRARAGEQHAPEARPFEADAGVIASLAAGKLLDVLARLLKDREGKHDGRQAVLEPSNALRRFRDPLRGRT